MEPRVNVYDGNGTLIRTIQAYQSAFRGGVHVATADVNGDSIPDTITAPGFGGGPVVRVWTRLERWRASSMPMTHYSAAA